MAERDTLRVVSLTDATDDGAIGMPIDCTGRPYVTVYVAGTGTISGGVVTIEESDSDPNTTPGGYTGTWSAVTTVNGTDATGGAQKAAHLTVSAYHFVRVRLTDAITGGGSVTVVLIAGAVS